MAKKIPDGFRTVTPHITVRNAEQAIDFYNKAFGSELLRASKGPDGKSIMHAEIRIGDSIVMLNDEYPEWGVVGPQGLGGTAVTIHLYVEDADSLFNRAVQAGATVKMPLNDAFWGDRYGQVVDPYGHQWSIATHKEDLAPDEVAKRGKEAMSNMDKPQ